MATTLTLSLLSADGAVRGRSSGVGLVQLDTRYAPYQPGDKLVLEANAPEVELELMLDESLPPSMVMLRGGRFVFPIPFDEARDPYGVQAFSGDCHWAYARELDPKERSNWQNLALNSHDLEGQTALFPHASTNSGATNPRFLARNAIDGTFQTCHHGRWPYESWGINGRDDAWLQVDFGRDIWAEELILWLRADFPHDCWWERATLTCSDGYTCELNLCKTGGPQRFDLAGRRISWVRLSELIRADDPSPWPGLSQLQVMGRLDAPTNQ